VSLMSSVLDCGQILSNTEIRRQIFINLTDFRSAVLSCFATSTHSKANAHIFLQFFGAKA
jgi:hypothetical protein